MIDEDGYLYIMARTDERDHVAGHRLYVPEHGLEGKGGFWQATSDVRGLAPVINNKACADSLKGQLCPWAFCA